MSMGKGEGKASQGRPNKQAAWALFIFLTSCLRLRRRKNVTHWGTAE